MASGLSFLAVLLVACNAEVERPMGWFGGNQAPNIGPGVLIGGEVQSVSSYPTDFASSDYPIWKLDRSAYVGALGYTDFNDPFEVIATTPCFDPEGRAGTVVNGQLVVLSAWGSPWASWDTGGSGAVPPAVDADGTWLVPANDHLLAVSTDGRLVYDVDAGGAITLQPAIGRDGSVALTVAQDGVVSLVVLESDGSLRGATDLAIAPAWLGRADGHLVAAAVELTDSGASETALVAVDGDALTELWSVRLDGSGTGVALYGDGDVVATAITDTAAGTGVMVRLRGSDGSEAARRELPWVPAAPSLDGEGHLWAQCDLGVCTYDRELDEREETLPYDPIIDLLPQPVSVAVADGWVGVAQGDGSYAAWALRGVKGPTSGWSRKGGGPAGAGRELGR